MKEKWKIVLSLVLVLMMLVILIPYSSMDGRGRDTGSSPIEELRILPTGEHWGMAWSDNAEYAAITGDKELFVYKEAGNAVINYSSLIGNNFYHDVEYDDSIGDMLMVGYQFGDPSYSTVDRFLYEPAGTVIDDTGDPLQTDSTLKVTGNDGNWTYGSEYVYSAANTTVVSADNMRLTDTPMATLSYSGTGSAYLETSLLQKMPIAETVYCNYSIGFGSWSVWGTLSGQQAQRATTGNDYTLDSGINSGKLTFMINGTAADAEQIIIYIYVDPAGFPVRSTVQASDSDIGTPLEALIGGADYNTAQTNYVVDKDGDGYLSSGDIRITTLAEVLNQYTGASSGEFYDLALNTSSSTSEPMMAVGINSEIAAYAGGIWSYKSLPAPYNTSTYYFYGVTLDETTSRFYLVGENSTGSKAAAFVAVPGAGGPGDYIFYEITAGLPADIKLLINIDWNQDYNYGIAVGEKESVYKLQYDAYNNSGIWTMLYQGSVSGYMQAVKWTPDNERAIMADVDANIFSYDVSTEVVSYVGQMPSANSIFEIAMRPHASTPYATAIGTNTIGNYYYTTSSTGTNIIANVDIPTINDYDIENGAGVSILNAMTDVDSTYMFYIDAYYVGSGNINLWDRIDMDIYVWNDLNNGQTSYPAESLTNSCTAFHLNYTGGSNGAATGAWTVKFPDIGGDNYQEVSIVNQSETFAVEADGYEHHYLFFNVTFGPQLRYSGNTAMTDAGDTSELLGYNDPDTWNMEIRAVDGTLPTNKESKYTEFGLYKYTSITVSGSPSGGAPPGMSVNLSHPNRVYYSANIDYQVGVKIGNLTDGAGHIIPATSVSVMAPDVDAGDSSISTKTYFTAADSELAVWDLPSPYLGGNGTFGDIAGGDILPYVEYASGSLVSTGHYDEYRHLISVANARVTSVDGSWTPSSDYVYIDADSDYAVSEGDIRVTAYAPYNSGSVVSAGDTDVATTLVDLNNAATTGPDHKWSPGVDEFIIDKDGDGNISALDVRVGPTYLVTGVYWYIDIPAGTARGSYVATITYTIYHP